MWASPSKVGHDVEHSAVLEVATRLQTEGLARLDIDIDGSLVALRQAFGLERQYGDDGERLCRACAALCRGLARASAPAPPAEAVGVLLQALDTLDERQARLGGGSGGGASASGGVDVAAADFLARELLGLARRLGAGSATAGLHPGSPGGHAGVVRLDELRAADRAYERLANLAANEPLSVGGGTDLVVTQEELLFQLAQQARAIGICLMASDTVRDTEAATFYFLRALRKLRLAGIADKDPTSLGLRQLMSDAEAQAERLRAPPTLPGTRSAEGSGSAPGTPRTPSRKADEYDDYCLIS